MNGSYVYATTQTDSSNPKNPYAGYMQLIFDGVYGESGTESARHNLKTGPQIPVDIVYPEDGVILVPSPMAIMKSTAAPDAARRVYDFAVP